MIQTSLTQTGFVPATAWEYPRWQVPRADTFGQMLEPGPSSGFPSPVLCAIDRYALAANSVAPVELSDTKYRAAKAMGYDFGIEKYLGNSLFNFFGHIHGNFKHLGPIQQR